MTALIDGKYEVIAKIKEGGMGSLYKVRHVLLNQVRVIKTMRPQFEENPDAKRRFQQEAQMATSLSHPNIATHFDFVEDKDHTFYMVMEFIEGVNLFEYLKRHGPPPVSTTLDVAIQTLSALGYLHRLGIVHRDISPENIMLTRGADGSLTVKLIDLGVAKQTASQGMTVTGMFLGKLKYGSPEQLGTLPSGEQIDGRSDLYSLGCVLYETLTGAPPFRAGTMVEYVLQHTQRLPKPFEESDPEGHVPANVRAAVSRALAKRRDERWKTAEDFAEALMIARELLPVPSRAEETRFLDELSRIAPSRAPVPRPRGVSDVEAKLAEAFTRDAVTPVGRTEAPFPESTTAATASQEGPTTALKRATRLMEAPPRPEPASVDRWVPEAAPPNRRLAAVAASALVLVAAAAIVVTVLSRRPPPVTAGPATGAVLLKVVPWGRVVSVVDENRGTKLDLPEVTTPARLELPPGSYRFTFRCDANVLSGAREVTQSARVIANQATSLTVQVPSFDVEAEVAAYTP